MASLYFARASVEITSATRWIRSVSHVAARPMAWGKTVAFPARATPCKPSFHQLYAGMPRREMPGATSCICATFSSRVMRETRSFTRCSRGRLGSMYAGRVGSLAAEAFAAVWAFKLNAPKNKHRNAMRNRKRWFFMAEILAYSVPVVQYWFAIVAVNRWQTLAGTSRSVWRARQTFLRTPARGKTLHGAPSNKRIDRQRPRRAIRALRR